MTCIKNADHITDPLHMLPLHKLLVVCLVSKEEAPWLEFVQRCQPFLARVIAKTLHMRGTAGKAEIVDDLVQETFLKLCARNFKALRRFQCEQETKLYAFLKKVASNIVHDYLRGIACPKHGGGREMIPLEFILHEFVGFRNASKHLQRQVLVKEIFRHLDTRCSDSAREYEVFELYYRQGLTAKEISHLRHVGLT